MYYSLRGIKFRRGLHGLRGFLKNKNREILCNPRLYMVLYGMPNGVSAFRCT